MTMRRRAFCASTGGLLLVGLGPSGGCGNDVAVPPEVPVALDLASASPTYGQLVVSPAALGLAVGDAIALRVEPRPAPGATPFAVPRAVLLVKRADDSDPAPWIAVDASCPHAGCPLGYSPRDQLIECPCHGSRFRATSDEGGCAGDVVHPPARQRLVSYVVTGNAASLRIDLARRACPAVPPPTVHDGAITLALADYPMLAEAGGAVVLDTVDGFPDPVAILRVDTSTFLALDGRCTHACCTVAWSAGEQRWRCPCHGSTYAADGIVANGPARFDLPSFVATFDGSVVTIRMLAPETMNDCG
jgi:cytochrome b6-f complex iron-sulfur subunit